jgi:cation diffusion facilitator CzcD-associated flavoprotein CzcO
MCLHADNLALGTKRPPLDLGWLDSLHWENVELVSIDLAEVKATGITTADGSHRDHDVIVYATGSDIAQHGVGANVHVHGENGLELEKYWASIGGPQAYAGIAVPHFPNYFIVLGPNSVAGSWGYTLARETIAVARIVRELVAYSLASVQPKEGIFEAENVAIKEKLETAVSGYCDTG